MALLLGLHGIPQAEAALIRTIVRLSSSLSPSWEVVEATDCHLLIHEAPLALPTAMTAGKPRCIPVRARALAAVAGELQRPIRAEELIALLNLEGARLTAVPATAAAAATPAAGAAMPAHPSSTVAARARLKQWPSWGVLKGRPHAVQLATHLSRAAYSAERLAQGTGLELEACSAFMQELDDHGLLAWHSGQPQAAAAAEAARPAAAAPNRGLLHSIRRRLRMS